MSVTLHFLSAHDFYTFTLVIQDHLCDLYHLIPGKYAVRCAFHADAYARNCRRCIQCNISDATIKVGSAAFFVLNRDLKRHFAPLFSSARLALHSIETTAAPQIAQATPAHPAFQYAMQITTAAMNTATTRATTLNAFIIHTSPC